MKNGEFGVDDITDYLNQELPGFEPNIIRNDGTQRTTLRVRTRVTFGSYVDIGNEHLFLAIDERSYQLKRSLDEFVRKTRQDLIHKLGLQKEIDAEVQRKLNAERQRIENEAYRKAMNDALDRVAKSQEKAREELAATAARLWNTFMGRTEPPLGPNGDGS